MKFTNFDTLPIRNGKPLKINIKLKNNKNANKQCKSTAMHLV